MKHCDFSSTIEKARLLDPNNILPHNIEENSDFVYLKLNLAKFGENYEFLPKEIKKLMDMSILERKGDQETDDITIVPQQSKVEDKKFSISLDSLSKKQMPNTVKTQ